MNHREKQHQSRDRAATNRQPARRGASGVTALPPPLEECEALVVQLKTAASAAEACRAPWSERARLGRELVGAIDQLARRRAIDGAEVPR